MEDEAPGDGVDDERDGDGDLDGGAGDMAGVEFACLRTGTTGRLGLA